MQTIVAEYCMYQTVDSCYCLVLGRFTLRFNPHFSEQCYNSIIAVHQHMAAHELILLLRTKANDHVRQVGFGFAERGIDWETQKQLY